MAMKNIFIAGHRGMVGRALCRAFEGDDDVNLITKAKAELDLTVQADVERFFDQNHIDEVYLAAAKVGGIYANNALTGEFIHQNLMIQSNVIHAAHRSGVQKLLFLGSSCIYPKFANQPIREEALLTGQLEPTNESYAVAKIAGIKLCEAYRRQYGRDYRSVMPTNLYGPYDNFHLELGTVISKFNIHNLSEIEDYVHSLGVQSYRNEIAEERAEFFNLGDAVTPDAETYERLASVFAEKIRANLSMKKEMTKVTESLRLVYYGLAVKILKEQRQVIPCYAGIANAHINYDGEVWPCCVLGYYKPMGFLRDKSYDFQKIWRSRQADRVRGYIKGGNCACPLANQAYSNILCSPKYLGKVLKTFLNLSNQ